MKWIIVLLALCVPASVQAQELRWGIFKSQKISTVRPDMARALADRMRVRRLIFVDHEGPVETIECLKAKKCDAAFIHLDDRARNVLDFSYPLIHYDFTILATKAPIKQAKDTDNPKMRVVVIKGHASTAAFARFAKSAALIEVETHEEAAALMRDGKAEAVASTRHSLHDIAKDVPGARVLSESYGMNINRVALPPGNPKRLSEINNHIEHMKTSGQLQKIVDRDKTKGGFVVAGPKEKL